MNDSTIILKRYHAYADSLRSYIVMLDGQRIGEIYDGEEKSFNISSGEHSIWLKIDWARSPILKFEAKKNQAVRFECQSEATGSKVLLAVLYATLWRNGYIKLQQINEAR
jgi:hypothetical protein